MIDDRQTSTEFASKIVHCYNISRPQHKKQE